MPSTVSIVATTFATVLVAEMVGDRSLCAVSALAARHRALPLLFGMAAAFMAKTLAAVLLGSAIGRLAGSTLSLVSAISFLASAVLLWRHSTKDVAPVGVGTGWAVATPVAFSSVFFTEWADVGQLTTAALAVQYQAPAAVWLGASLALAAKGTLAVTLGVGLRRVIPVARLRQAAITLCLVMAGVSLYGSVAHAS